MFNFCLRSLSITLSALILLAGLAGPLSAAGNSSQKGQDQHQKALIRQAKLSLDRVERAIKKDAYYSARAALNIWRSSAMDAGTFDQELYDSLKKRIYLDSIANNRNYFNDYLARNNFYEARICLEIWRLHSEEIEILDESTYDKLNGQLNKAIARQKALDAKKKAEAAKKSSKQKKKE